jgi:hypothetical protein
MWNKAIAINMRRTKANTEVDHGCMFWANAEELIQHRVLTLLVCSKSMGAHPHHPQLLDVCPPPPFRTACSFDAMEV